MADFEISEDELSISRILSGTTANCGAEALFIGKVRNHRDGKSVLAIEYDAFVPLALEVMSGLAREARKKWGERLQIRIAHRLGRLAVGDLCVVIRVESPHRAEAFAACRFLIEEIKRRVPIWKKEFYDDGESEWVRGHALCRHPGHRDHSGGRQVLPYGSG